MAQIDTQKIFKSLGWQISQRRSGGFTIEFYLADRILTIVPMIQSRGMTSDNNVITLEEEIRATLFLSTKKFNEAFSIVANHLPNTSLAFSGEWPRIETAKLLEEHVHQISNEAIAWAKRQDIEKALEEYAAASPQNISCPKIEHLAALALFGDARRLRSYRESFERGDRLGFPDFVTEDFIRRALTLAQRKTQ